MSKTDPGAHKILSVSYDEILLVTRQMLLEQAGYVVTSALGFAEGMERCRQASYDLMIIGHSIPHQDKAELIKVAKQHCRCLVVSIRRHGDAPHPQADFSVDSLDGPQALITEVQKALKASRSAK